MTTVEFKGETYRIAEKVGLAPLIRFGKLAKVGADSADVGALAVMYDVLEQCFDTVPYCAACGSQDTAALATADADTKCCDERRVVQNEFDRFMDVATAARWDHEEILDVVGAVMEELSKRPTGRSSVSESGPPTARPNYEDDLSLRAQRRLEEAGRADLAVAVLDRREYAKTTPRAV